MYRVIISTTSNEQDMQYYLWVKKNFWTLIFPFFFTDGVKILSAIFWSQKIILTLSDHAPESLNRNVVAWFDRKKMIQLKKKKDSTLFLLIFHRHKWPFVNLSELFSHFSFCPFRDAFKGSRGFHINIKMWIFHFFIFFIFFIFQTFDHVDLSNFPTHLSKLRTKFNTGRFKSFRIYQQKPNTCKQVQLKVHPKWAP